MAAISDQEKQLYERYISIYNQLDTYMRKYLRDDKHTDHAYLIQQIALHHRLFARYEQELKEFARLRNVLIHNHFGEAAHPIATPHPYVVDLYQRIIDAVLNPVTALSIAVHAAQIYTTTLNAKALDVMKLMTKNTYTHVPVMEDDQMVGIFSENTILSYLSHHENSIITADMPIREFADFVGLDQHKSEEFAFIERKALLADVYALFNAAVKKHKRLGMLFITEHGKQSEKLLGIITAWDLASPEFKN